MNDILMLMQMDNLNFKIGDEIMDSDELMKNISAFILNTSGMEFKLVCDSGEELEFSVEPKDE